MLLAGNPFAFPVALFLAVAVGESAYEYDCACVGRALNEGLVVHPEAEEMIKNDNNSLVAWRGNLSSVSPQLDGHE